MGGTIYYTSKSSECGNLRWVETYSYCRNQTKKLFYFNVE